MLVFDAGLYPGGQDAAVLADAATLPTTVCYGHHYVEQIEGVYFGGETQGYAAVAVHSREPL